MAHKETKSAAAGGLGAEGTEDGFTRPQQVRFVACVAVTVGLFTYWSLFHDFALRYGGGLVLRAAVAPVAPSAGGFVNCAVRPLGMAVGCCGMLVLRHCNIALSSTLSRWALIAMLPIGLVPYALVGVSSSWEFAILSHLALSALVVYPLTFLLASLVSLGRKTVLGLAAGTLLASKCYSAIVMPLLAETGLPLVAFVGNAIPLVVAIALWNEAELVPAKASSAEPAGGNRLPVRRAMQPLTMHLVFYGFGLGLFHSMLGVGFGMTGQVRMMLNFLGTIAAAVVALVAVRNVTQEEDLWQNIRGVVFPSAIIGFLLIPATSVYAVSAVLEEFSLSYYTILFIMGCYLMISNTVVRPLTVIVVGLLLKSIGSFVGIALGAFLSVSNIAENDQWVALTTALVFAAFTLGTFWVGKDSDLRKWWGLRRNYTAQQFRDRVIEQKTAKLAAEHSLSQREQEILVKLAQGKRAQQISEECYISIYTVRNHTQRIYKKLDVHSFTELDSLFATVSPED